MDAGSVPSSMASVACSGCSGKVITRRTNPFFSSAPEAQAELSHLRSRPRVPGHLPYSMSTSVALTTSPSPSLPQPAAVHASAQPDPHGYEIVINATPLGMKPDDPMPVDPNRLEPGSIVVDIINSPDPTPLCRAARARGCRTQSGRPMHEGQAVHALRFLGFDYLPEGKVSTGHRLAVSGSVTTAVLDATCRFCTAPENHG